MQKKKKTAEQTTSSAPGSAKQSPASQTVYRREAHLRDAFNRSVATALGLAAEDYYGRLSFDGVLTLKEGYAWIHDIVTLKLSVALVEAVADRLTLAAETRAQILANIDIIHPNTAGFDLDSEKPNIIGEVKGTIPVNAGNSFGAAQKKGLTSDVLQMLGQPASGKVLEELSDKNKVHRPHRRDALKFLGLYDSPPVRAAAASWARNLTKSKAWRELSALQIEELPKTGDLSPDTVYVVYLTPLFEKRRSFDI